MTVVELRDHVGGLLDGWTESEMIGSLEESDAGFPAATGDVEDPATLITWGLGREEPVNENGWHSAFDGSEIWEGEILLQVWIEKEVGDRKQREHLRDLRRSYLSAALSDISEFHIGSPRIADAFDSESGFAAVEGSYPYVRFATPVITRVTPEGDTRVTPEGDTRVALE